jgi:hypothetical protein
MSSSTLENMNLKFNFVWRKKRQIILGKDLFFLYVKVEFKFIFSEVIQDIITKVRKLC